MTRLELRILQSAGDYPELSVRGLASAATSPVPLNRGEAESGVSVSAVARQQVRDAEGVVRKLIERGFLDKSDDGVVLTPRGGAIVDPASRPEPGASRAALVSGVPCASCRRGGRGQLHLELGRTMIAWPRGSCRTLLGLHPRSTLPR